MMEDNQLRDSLFQYKAKKAVKLLYEEIHEIPDVQTWASEAGVSRRWLYKAMKLIYRKPPKEMIRNIRHEAILDCLKEDPEMTGYCLARETGLKDEKALYKFLSVHFDSNLTQLRVNYLRE